MKKLFFASVFLLLIVPCRAGIIIVDDDWPYDFNNVQAAIDYSSNSDFIFVFPGTYRGTGNRDGLIDTADLALLIEDWLEQTTWH